MTIVDLFLWTLFVFGGRTDGVFLFVDTKKKKKKKKKKEKKKKNRTL